MSCLQGTLSKAEQAEAKEAETQMPDKDFYDWNRMKFFEDLNISPFQLFVYDTMKQGGLGDEDSEFESIRNKQTA